ncbi:MAG: integrin alpha [Sandaracinaceae bacterium]|nr:integrin alpha [Sandaracinaceae bacterium]
MILGAPAEDYGGATDPGRAYLVLGGATEPVAAWQSVTIPRAVNFVSFGTSVAAIGDVNGDGYADVAIGAPNMLDDAETNNGGAVFVFYGGPSALTGPTILRSPAPSSSAKFGQSVSAAGDLDLDGYPDLVAVEPNGQTGSTRRLRAWIFRGGPDGVDPTATELGAGIPDAEAAGGFALVTSLPAPSTRLVIATARATVGGLMNAGRVHVFESSDWVDPAWTIDAAAPLSGERFGSSIANAGDLFGDGFRDLIVGIPDVRIEVIDLGPSGPSGLRASVDGFGAVGYAWAVCGVGELNGDGHADVVVANPMASRADVWLGGPTTLVDPPRLSFTGEGRLGESCALDTP